MSGKGSSAQSGIINGFGWSFTAVRYSFSPRFRFGSSIIIAFSSPPASPFHQLLYLRQLRESYSALYIFIHYCNFLVTIVFFIAFLSQSKKENIMKRDAGRR
jgi:hypothetical protein